MPRPLWIGGARLMLPATLALALGACGSSAAGPHAPDFSVCANVDAGPYMAGTTVTSSAGAFAATLVSVSTKTANGATVEVPTVGQSTFTVSVTEADGSVWPALQIKAEKPYMPFHMHGSPNFPTVSGQGGGTYDVSEITFFMSGYWEVTLDLTATLPDGGATGAPATEPDGDAGDPAPQSGDGGAVTPPAVTTDKIVLPICIPA